MGVVLAAVLTLTLGSVSPAPAAQMQAVMPGFNAQFVRNFGGAVCDGRGPTAVTLFNNTVYFAAGEYIYAVGGGRPLGNARGPVGPWGLAVAGGKLYATSPGCGATASPGPVNDNCNVVEMRPDNAKVVGQVSTLCGFALAADPRTGQLTVGGRDGRVVNIRTDSGDESGVIIELGSDPAVSLVWAPDGSRLFLAQQSGKASVLDRGSSRLRSLPTGRTSALATGNGVNMNGSVLAAGDGPAPVKAVAVDEGAPAGDVASSSSSVAVVVAAPDGIYVAQPTEIWLLRGRYTPPPRPGAPPPAAPPPPTIRPRITPTSVVRGATPALPPQAPPPPPPPAPPAPPLATAAQVVAQPSAVANPAIVPGESEREAAMRLAATGRPRPLSPSLLWLALAILVCGGGLGAGIAAGRSRSDAGRYAWAENR